MHNTTPSRSPTLNLTLQIHHHHHLHFQFLLLSGTPFRQGRKGLLYSSMPLILIRASSLPSKLLDKLHFLNFNKIFLFLNTLPLLANPFCGQDTSFPCCKFSIDVQL